jgi:hypothetical protein
MELRVHEVAQAASAGSHVTIYEAEVELVPGEVRVEVAGVYPCDADPEAIASAADAIRLGAQRVLQPRGLGAIIRVSHLVVHPIDFKPGRFERHTAEELGRLVEAASEAELEAQRPRTRSEGARRP